jgi:hypothetical protein
MIVMLMVGSWFISASSLMAHRHLAEKFESESSTESMLFGISIFDIRNSNAKGIFSLLMESFVRRNHAKRTFLNFFGLLFRSDVLFVDDDGFWLLLYVHVHIAYYCLAFASLIR